MAITGLRVKINSAGVVQILKLSTVQADLARRGEAIKNALPTGNGEEWATANFIGYDRAQTIVKTANHQAREAAAEDNVLQRAIDAGR